MLNFFLKFFLKFVSKRFLFSCHFAVTVLDEIDIRSHDVYHV